MLLGISVFDTYNVYLKPGTYYVKIEDATVDTIEVSLGEMTKDYEMYSCKGELLDMADFKFQKTCIEITRFWL